MLEENPQILSEKRTVGLVCKPERPLMGKIASQLVDTLVSLNVDVQVDKGSCDVIHQKAEPTAIEDMDVDFVITIGGDGTSLYTLTQLKDREMPLFCVNRGTVGFMTEASTTAANGSLKRILDNDCIIESVVNLSSGVGDTVFEDARELINKINKTRRKR